MCSCTTHYYWTVCLSDIGLFQDQYVFLYHALLDGLQTGHLAYPVSQFHSLCKILCEDDVNLSQLREQFQVISMNICHYWYYVIQLASSMYGVIGLLYASL